MVVFKQCCCCCSLKTGSIVYGWIGLVSCIINMGGVAIFLAKYDPAHETDTIKKPDVFDQPDIYGARGLEDYMQSQIAALVILTIAYALLIAGAIKGNRYLLLPWLVTDMFGLVAGGLVVIIGAIVIASTASALGAALILAIGLPLIALQTYLWLCVFSLFQHLRQLDQFQPVVMLATKPPESPPAYNVPSTEYIPQPPAYMDPPMYNTEKLPPV